MAVYDSARALALRLVTKKGRAGVRILSVGDGAAPSLTPWKPAAAADVLLATVHAAFLSPVEAAGGPQGQYAFPVYERSKADQSMSIHPEATLVAYVAASEPGLVGKEITAGMLVETAGSRYVVLRNVALVPGPIDQPVLYTLSLKG